MEHGFHKIIIKKNMPQSLLFQNYHYLVGVIV